MSSSTASSTDRSLLNQTSAENEFLHLLDRIPPGEIARFLQWISDSFTTDEKQLPSNTDRQVLEADVALREIASQIRSQVPISAILDSEKSFWPEYGLDSDCKPETTVHVDSFLYDEAEIDRLCESGSLNRNYCCACGSHATRPLTFISHSLSIDQLRFIFTALIPLSTMHDRLLIDVGSRLGAVICAAHLYGNGAVKAVGVEMNAALCEIQKHVIDNCGMGNRVAVICSDIREQGDLLQTADIVVMNNVFCFFLPPQEQVLCWRFMHKHVRPGALLVAHPSLAQVTGHLDLGFDLDSWVEKVRIGSHIRKIPYSREETFIGHLQHETEQLAAKFAGASEELYEDCAKICLYSVKGAAT